MFFFNLILLNVGEDKGEASQDCVQQYLDQRCTWRWRLLLPPLQLDGERTGQMFRMEKWSSMNLSTPHQYHVQYNKYDVMLARVAVLSTASAMICGTHPFVLRRRVL